MIPLPPGITSRLIPGINGLTMHVLEAGNPAHKLILLLHGFPELAYSWRKIMVPLAEAGFHVVAPDQRGYGRTTGWSDDYDGSLVPFRLFNLVRDVLGLVQALGHTEVALLAGHDFGSPVAAWCALLRPDIFRRLTLMSAPFAGPPRIGAAAPKGDVSPERDVHADLAALPRPRKHYQWYYSTPEANANMQHARQGVGTFLRAYYHHKSADWPGNTPFKLAGWTAAELAKMPTYYIMDLHEGMAETVAHEMPAGEAPWLTDAELAVYAAEYARTGFQGGLQWYRCGTTGAFTPELELFSGRTIDIPSCFIAGSSDWGVQQRPGAVEAMNGTACTDMRFCDLIEGAGHWVQQEQPAAVVEKLLGFLKNSS